MNREEDQNQVVVRLVEAEENLWRQFASLTNEMGINHVGRKIFPKLDYRIEGLDAEKMYALVLEIHQVDDFCYKFCDGQWVESGWSKYSSIEANKNAKKIPHVDGVKTGEEWMKFAVNFDHVKLTNRLKKTSPTHFILHLMHKYVPVLTIYEVSSILKPVAVFKKMDCTQFITVKKYQNQAVKWLKFNTNPLFTQYLDTKRRHSSSSPEASRSQPKQAKLDVASPTTDTLPLSAVLPQFLAPNPFIPPAYIYSQSLMQIMPPHLRYFDGFLGATMSFAPPPVEDDGSKNLPK